MGLHPYLISFGFDRSPDANTKDQQVEDDGGHQSWDVQSHVEVLAGAATHAEQAIIAG